MITDEEFGRIVFYMKQRYGIDLSQKKVIVNGRLENYIKKKGWNNFNDFMNAVENDKSGNEEKMLVNFLTTNHTYFMREFEHFDFFKGTVLPWLKKKEEKNKDLRIWCGAASTGEEPYMIAMVLSDFFGLEKNQWDTRVLATDISTRALQQAMSGIYGTDQVNKMPEQWRRHFFKALPGGQFQVKDELKKEVIFSRTKTAYILRNGIYNAEDELIKRPSILVDGECEILIDWEEEPNMQHKLTATRSLYCICDTLETFCI